jgi:peptidoglycan hydrolase-like protein with peptidoglycan-binding domain
MMPAIPLTIQEGASGESVRQLQYELVRCLLLGGPPDIDGQFGPKTKQAVLDYQGGAGLTTDGVVGPATWGKLLAQFDIPPILSEGETGIPVEKLQNALNEWGSQYAAPWTALSVDQDFGPITKTVVEQFQTYGQKEYEQLAVDGVVGYQTWTVRFEGMNHMLAGIAGV